MGELQVRVGNQLGNIEFNYEELKDNLTIMMSAYEGAEFTEDSSNIAKKESATLKKIKKALSDRRIEIKKEYMKPYDDFEAKVKELTSLIDKPIELIDAQVKAFDKKKKAEKREKIQTLYTELIGGLGEYLPLSKIYNVKWENSSTSMKSVQEEIETVISSTDMAVSTIKGMNSEVTDKALEQFKADLSLANAISYINKHEQLKAEILAREEQKRKEEEERKRLAEIERVKSEERKKIAEEEKAERERLAEIERVGEEERLATERRLMGAKEPESVEEFIPPESDELEDAFVADEEPFDLEEPFKAGEPEDTIAKFRVVGTYEELKQIEMYMNSIGVEWERSDN